MNRTTRLQLAALGAVLAVTSWSVVSLTAQDRRPSGRADYPGRERTRETPAREQAADETPAPRDRDTPAPRDRDRRGVPQDERFLPRERERDETQATEEGMPQTRLVPGGRIRPDYAPQWRLGVYAVNTRTGVRVDQVVPGSAAWRVGLEPGDRILTIEGYQIGYVNNRLYPLGEELQVRAGNRGDVNLLVQNQRTGELLVLPVQLDRYPFRR